MMDLKMYKRPLAVLTATGDRVRVTPGVLSRFGTAFADSGINVYAVSTGEYSVSFYVDELDHERAKKALHGVVGQSAFISLAQSKDIGMLTITGQELIDSPGMLLRIVKPVSEAGINILSMSASFDSVILFVGWQDVRKAYEMIEKQFLKGL